MYINFNLKCYNDSSGLCILLHTATRPAQLPEIVLRPDPNFWDSSHHRIFDFGIRITGESESIFQFWDFLRIFQQNLAFFNKTLHYRWPNFKIFFPYYTIFQQNLVKILQNQANHWRIPDSNLEKKIRINPKSLKKWDLIRIRGSRIRFCLNTSPKDFDRLAKIKFSKEWRPKTKVKIT